MNHYFADNLRKAREDRIKKQLVNLQSWTINNSLKQPLLCLKDTITTFLNNEDIYNKLLIILRIVTCLVTIIKKRVLFILLELEILIIIYIYP
jgi:hypothetical protein